MKTFNFQNDNLKNVGDVYIIIYCKPYLPEDPLQEIKIPLSFKFDKDMTTHPEIDQIVEHLEFLSYHSFPSTESLYGRVYEFSKRYGIEASEDFTPACASLFGIDEHGAVYSTYLMDL